MADEEQQTFDHDAETSETPPDLPVGDNQTPLPSAPIPETIGRYRVISVIGEGAMGIVYETEQEAPRRTVAIKVIRAGVASTSQLRRFEHETQILGRLDHPGIATIFEAGTFDTGAGPQPFFAMELVKDRSLTEHAKDKKLGTHERLKLLARVAEAVQHAHQKGVIHRDLKPGNILVTDDDQVKVLDFGVARATNADIQTPTLRTDIGQLIGTIPYMSPEQAAGDPDELDTRSDVYGLGVMAYELLAGRLPYDISRKMIHEAVRVIREDDPTPLSSINHVFRGDIEIIIGKTLQKEKDHRYQNVSDFASDIHRYLNDEPIVARPPSMGYQLRKFTRRNKALVGGVVSVLLVSIIGTIVSITFALIAQDQAKEAQYARGLAYERELDATKARDAEREAKEETQVALELARQRELDAMKARDAEREAKEETQEALELAEQRELDATKARDAEREAREETQLALELARQREQEANREVTQRKIAEREARDEAAAARAAEKESARQRDEAEWKAYVANMLLANSALQQHAITSALHRLSECPVAPRNWEWQYLLSQTDRSIMTVNEPVRSIRCMAVDSSGTRLAIGSSDATIKIWNTHDQSEPLTLADQGAPVGSLAFAPDGSLFASAADRVVKLWSVDTDDAIAVLPQSRTRVTSVAFSPDGMSLAVAGGQDVLVWDITTGRYSVSASSPSSATRTVTFSTDGTRLVSTLSNTDVVVWDSTTGRRLSTWSRRPDPGANEERACNHAGTHIAIESEDSSISVFDIATDEIVSTLRGHLFGITNLMFSPTGRFLAPAAIDQTVRLWDIDTGDLVAMLGVTGGEIPIIVAGQLAFSPNGTFLVAASPEGHVKLWDLRGVIGDYARRQDITASWSPMNELLNLDLSPAKQCVVWSVAPSPDGSLVASGLADGSIVIMDSTTEDELCRIRAHASAVRSLAFDHTGTCLVTGSVDGLVKLWDIGICTELQSLRGHNDAVTSVTFDAMADCVVSGSNDCTVKVWNTHDMQELTTLRMVSKSPSGFGSDSHSFVSTVLLGDLDDGETIDKEELIELLGGTEFGPTLFDEGTREFVNSELFNGIWDGDAVVKEVLVERFVKIFEMFGGSSSIEELDQTLMKDIMAIAFSPDGTYIAALSIEGQITCWNTSTYQESASFQYGAGGICLALSPDGTQIVTGGADRVAMVWDASTGRAIHTLDGHGGPVLSVAFSPDGSRIVTGSVDGLIKLWDSSTGDEILSCQTNPPVTCVTFGPEGKRIFYGALDGSVEVLDSVPSADRFKERVTAYLAETVMQPSIRDLFEQGMAPDRIVDQVRNDQSLTDTQRRAALNLILKRCCEMRESAESGSETDQ